MPGIENVLNGLTMIQIGPSDLSAASIQSNRRAFMTLFAGASVALAGAAVTGCSDWDMRADPPKKKPKTMIIGRGSGPGGGPGRP